MMNVHEDAESISGALKNLVAKFESDVRALSTNIEFDVSKISMGCKPVPMQDLPEEKWQWESDGKPLTSEEKSKISIQKPVRYSITLSIKYFSP